MVGRWVKKAADFGGKFLQERRRTAAAARELMNGKRGSQPAFYW